ncbi:MAG: EamA family transporter [Burkholderiales bacterium]
MQLWFLLSLGASILWGISYVIEEYLLKTFTYKEVMLSQIVILFLILLPYLLYEGAFGGFVSKLSNIKNLAIFTLNGIVFSIANILILKGIKVGNASLAATIESAYPLFTLAFAYLILGEKQVSLTSLMGCLITICGLIIVKLGS